MESKDKEIIIMGEENLAHTLSTSGAMSSTENMVGQQEVNNEQQMASQSLEQKTTDCDPQDPGDVPITSVEMFDDTKIWCQDCKIHNSESCRRHPVTAVKDRKIPSRARLTIPNVCQLQKFGTQLGIIAKKPISKRTRFGPLVAKEMGSVEMDDFHHQGILFKLLGKDGSVCMDISNEEDCNWLMFVRPAQVIEEQNVVVFQHNQSIYFTTIKPVKPGTELKFWYTSHYAQYIGAPNLVKRSQLTATKSVIFREGFPCDTCDEVFKEFEELDAHACLESREDEEGRRTRNKRKGKPQKLHQSGSRESRPASQRAPRHQLTSINKTRTNKTKSCIHCDETFTTIRSLSLHTYKHTGELPYKCDVIACGKAFNTKFKLSRHALCHSEIRQFSCSQCDKSFVRKDHLKNHLPLHDQNRATFVCEYEECRKIYSTAAAFKTHKAVHKAKTGSLECDLCNQLFDSQAYLLTHIKVHAGSRSVKGVMEKKFRCSHCEKRFFTQKDVKRHIVTHTRERKFICPICSQGFGRNDHLTRHLKKNHSPSKTQAEGKVIQPDQSSPNNGVRLDFNRSIQQMVGTDSSSAVNIQTVNNSHVLTPVESTVQVTAMLPTITDSIQAHELISGPVFPGNGQTSSLPQSQKFISLNTFLNGFIPVTSQSDSHPSSSNGSKPYNHNLTLQNMNWQSVMLTDPPPTQPRTCQLLSAEHREPGTATLLITDCSPTLNLSSETNLRNNMMLDGTETGRELPDASTSEYADAMKILGNFTPVTQSVVCVDQEIGSVYVQPTFTQSNLYR